MEKQFRVKWEIDIYAETPLEAANFAREIQLRTDTTANFFEVRDCHENKVFKIDLEKQKEVKPLLVRKSYECFSNKYKDRYEESRILTLQNMPRQEE